MQCVVEKLFNAEFDIVKGHCVGMHCDIGQSCTLRIVAHGGRKTNVAVVCTSHVGAHFAAELFETAGLNPWAAAVRVKHACRLLYQRTPRH